MSERKHAADTEQAFAICERVAEVQALLHDHIECGKHTAADVVAKVQAILSEAELRTFDLTYVRKDAFLYQCETKRIYAARIAKPSL
jgi:hypothetical protein